MGYEGRAGFFLGPVVTTTNQYATSELSHEVTTNPKRVHRRAPCVSLVRDLFLDKLLDHVLQRDDPQYSHAVRWIHNHRHVTCTKARVCVRLLVMSPGIKELHSVLWPR